MKENILMLADLVAKQTKRKEALWQFQNKFNGEFIWLEREREHSNDESTAHWEPASRRKTEHWPPDAEGRAVYARDALRESERPLRTHSGALAKKGSRTQHRNEEYEGCPTQFEVWLRYIAIAATRIRLRLAHAAAHGDETGDGRRRSARLAEVDRRVRG